MNPGDQEFRLEVPRDLSQLATIRDWARNSLNTFPNIRSFIPKLILVIDECVTNSIEHGKRLSEIGKLDFEKDTVCILIRRADSDSKEQIDIMIEDKCEFFDPNSIPPVNPDLFLEGGWEGGMGIHNILQIVDLRTEYQTNTGNKWILSFPKRGVEY
jgi:anti-sigma regulatory factor (Ser/Thr protein kinase)